MQLSLFTMKRPAAQRRSTVASASEVRDANGYLVPQPAWDKTITTTDVWCAFKADARVSIKAKTSEWHLRPGEYGFWDKIIECGRSYMVGTGTPMKEYLGSHSSPLSKWQRTAYEWALQNPDSILEVDTKTHHWRVYLRGEYVEFALPHQSFGGEKNYVTKDGKKKVLVNVD